MVQEAPVVAHNQHAALVMLQEILQKHQRIYIQVVGRLVQNQEIGIGHQRPYQVQPAAFAPAQIGEIIILGSRLELKVIQELGCRDFAAVLHADHLGHFLDDVDDPPVFVRRKPALGVIAELDGIAHDDAARIRLQGSGQQVQQGGLADAVAPHDAHFLPFLENIGEIIDQLLTLVALAEVIDLQYLPA